MTAASSIAVADGASAEAGALSVEGHDAVEHALRQSWQRGTLPHALLFSGPMGIGKASMAYRLAQHLLTHDAPAAAQGTAAAEDESGSLFDALPLATDTHHAQDTPDDTDANTAALAENAEDAATGFTLDPQHPALARIRSGSHSDFMVIRPGATKSSRDISVEQIRKIKSFLALTPAESSCRVVMVDPADSMNHNASKALLKMLEEPPAHAYLILVSHHAGKLLPTLRSRCHAIRFSPLDAQAYHRIMDVHVPDMDAQTAAALCQLSDGSPGQALLLHQHDALAHYERVCALTLQAPDVPVAALYGWAESTARAPSRDQVREHWHTVHWVLLTWLRRLIAPSVGAVPAAPIVMREAEAHQHLLQIRTLDYWLTIWDKTQQLLQDTAAVHLDPAQVLTSIGFGITAQGMDV